MATIKYQNNVLRIAGDLNFKTTPPLLETSRPFFTKNTDLCFDLSDVHKSNSAGLALLLEWKRLAREHKKKIRFLNVPVQLGTIAKASEVGQILFLT
jgi:phospholipid transport system transporter-binding protein